MTMAIDPSMLGQGAEWSTGSVGGVDQAPGAAGVDGVEGTSSSGGGFGQMLSEQVSKLQGLQDDASTASQQLATGQATDPTSVVMAVEKARLAMQLASTVRTKGVEAMNDIFHTQV